MSSVLKLNSCAPKDTIRLHPPPPPPAPPPPSLPPPEQQQHVCAFVSPRIRHSRQSALQESGSVFIVDGLGGGLWGVLGGPNWRVVHL
jgi:hypothetical protein